jgi:ariadne-1
VGSEEFGDYIDDEDIDGFGGGEEEEDQPKFRKMPSVSAPLAPSNNFTVEILQANEIRSVMLSKLVNFKNKFDYANFSEGHFLEWLRKQNFMLDKAVDRLQERLYELLDNPRYQNVVLDKNEKYMCNILCDEYEADQIRHFGCGHTFEESCMDEYITEEVKRKGPPSIDTRCPYEGCNLLVTEDVVEATCKKTIVEIFKKFMVDDFISRAPYIVPCVATKCFYYFVVPDKSIQADNAIPQKNVLCNCGTTACIGCSKVGHEPLSCKMFEDWNSSSESIQDRLNSEWKKHNTKACPKCHTDIEKNQGCMHMTCAHCRHEFCWLCIGDWKTHGSNTGGFFACNIYKPEKTKDEDKDMLKKLQFFYDRFFQHKRSLEVSENKYRDLLEKYKFDSESNIALMNSKVMPGSLDFYRESYKCILKARSFIVYTYPLAYFIQNDTELALFLQTQYMLEYALEKLDKFCENLPLEKFIIQDKKKGLYHSSDFPQNRQTMLNLVHAMEGQFANANREFKEKAFLDKISISQKKGGIGQMIDKRNESSKPATGGSKAPSKPTTASWLCTICTYHNENSNRETCTMCGRNGKPKHL